jgi:hypothetical protein
MILDGISASQHLDSSGEVLDIKNHDISDLVEGRGVLNFEHNNDSPDDIIGSIIFAKKIMKKDDCENDRELMYWDACGTPFVYIKAELFDNEDHPGAVAAAAMVRYYHKREQKILAGFSIEGATLEREDNYLKRSVGRRVALTLRPCNKSAISGVYSDEPVNAEIKKFMTLSDNPNVKTVEVDSLLLDDIEKTEGTESNLLNDLKKSIITLNKTLTAGGYDVAPSQLSGGSALQTEHKAKKRVGLSKELKEKLKRVAASWDGKRPIKRDIKAIMPEVSDYYLNHFAELTEELALKKGMPQPVRIDSFHSWNTKATPQQKELITGLYLDPKTTDKVPLKNDAGNTVLLRYPKLDTPLNPCPACLSSIYYQLASGYFGMKGHVPVTNYFTHKSLGLDGKNIQAQEKIEGAHTPGSAEWVNTVKRSRETGSSHKLAIMDMILDADADRSFFNMVGKDGIIINIDNNNVLKYNNEMEDYPSHFFDFKDSDGNIEPGIGDDLLHVDAARWLSMLDPKELVASMLAAGASKNQAVQATKRLKLIQKYASGKTIKQIHDIIHPKKLEAEV